MKTKYKINSLHTASILVLLLTALLFACNKNTVGSEKEVTSTQTTQTKAQDKVNSNATTEVPVSAKKTVEKSELAKAFESVGFFAFEKPVDIPPFVVKALNGKADFKSESLKGKITFLNFWATWCPPCQREMPEIETFYNQFKDNEKFQFIAISVREKKDTVKNFIDKKGYTFPIYLDENAKVSPMYVAQGIPDTYIINEDGQVIAGRVGAYEFENSEFIETVKRILK